MGYDADNKTAGYDEVQGLVVDLCRWLVLTVADTDGGWYADDGRRSPGNRREDNDGVPIS